MTIRNAREDPVILGGFLANGYIHWPVFSQLSAKLIDRNIELPKSWFANLPLKYRILLTALTTDVRNCANPLLERAKSHTKLSWLKIEIGSPGLTTGHPGHVVPPLILAPVSHIVLPPRSSSCPGLHTSLPSQSPIPSPTALCPDPFC